MAAGGNFKKEVPISKRFCFLHAGTANMQGPKKIKKMASMLWQHLLPPYHVMCTEAQQENDLCGCHNSCRHLHSADI